MLLNLESLKEMVLNGMVLNVFKCIELNVLYGFKRFKRMGYNSVAFSVGNINQLVL